MSAVHCRDAVIITIGDTLTSLLCGVVVFSILGSIAYQLNVPVEEAVGHGKGGGGGLTEGPRQQSPVSRLYTCSLYANQTGHI